MRGVSEPAQATAGGAFARRVQPGRLLTDDAATIANACHDMAVRFHRGGKLLVFGNPPGEGPADRPAEDRFGSEDSSGVNPQRPTDEDMPSQPPGDQGG